MRNCTLLLILVSLFAQASQAATIEFWHSMGGPKGALLAQIIQGFNDLPENRGQIVVHGQFVGSYDEGLNKLRTAVLAGTEPHLVQITDVGSQLMIDSARTVPLQDFIDHDPSFPLAEILPAIRHYYELGGRLHSLPFATSNPVLYYNAESFTQADITHPPTTFSELEDDARRLTDAKNHIYGLTWPLHSWFLEEFVALQGALLVTPANGRGSERSRGADYLSAACVRVVSLWAKMVKDGTFANVGRGWDPAEQNFIAGRARMFITSTSDIFEIIKEAPFKVGVAALPMEKPPGAATVGGTVVGGNSIWLMKNKPTSEREVAYRFLKYMASASVQENWHIHTGYFPIRRDVIENLKKQGFYLKNPAAWVAIEQLLASPDTPAARGALIGVFPEAREHLMTAIEEVLSNRMTVEAALKLAKAKSEHSLTRYNDAL